MSEFARWLAPVAIVAVQQCYAAQYLSVEQAQAAIFGNASHFVPASLKLSKEQVLAIEAASGVSMRSNEQRVWEARTDAGLLGWFIVDQVIGKHELITYAVGLNADGSVRQIEVMEYREAYGYEVRNPAWRRQFVGKRAGDTLVLDQDIKNITGATLSCRHITEGVKRLLALYRVALR